MPQDAAVLLDKIYKFEHNTTYELGGEAALEVLQAKGAVAAHTTCYEQKTKVTGLKVKRYREMVMLVHACCVLFLLCCCFAVLLLKIMYAVCIHLVYDHRQQMPFGIRAITTLWNAPSPSRSCI